MNIEWYLENEKGERITFVTYVDNIENLLNDYEYFEDIEGEIGAYIEEDLRDLEPEITPNQILKLKKLHKNTMKDKIKRLNKLLGEK